MEMAVYSNSPLWSPHCWLELFASLKVGNLYLGSLSCSGMSCMIGPEDMAMCVNPVDLGSNLGSCMCCRRLGVLL